MLPSSRRRHFDAAASASAAATVLAQARRLRYMVALLGVFLLVFFVYVASLVALRRPTAAVDTSPPTPEQEETGRCCEGVEGLELWGDAVTWGSGRRAESARSCCTACKATCRSSDGKCAANSWVFCGDRDRCKERFGECWLKKQKDVLSPSVAARGPDVMWTSGLVFGNGEGIIGLETEHGTLRIKLLPGCSPHSMAYITELLGSRHCSQCRIIRAEGRGLSWDSDGNHVMEAGFGHPNALLQGMLDADGVTFNGIPPEGSWKVRRGSVAWVGSGPEFFISLANREEWVKQHTVFGTVLPDDMSVAETIAGLPTAPAVWGNVSVSVLEKPVAFKLKRYGYVAV